jgi:drug/metabolite transporter (DMT)-like permease
MPTQSASVTEAAITDDAKQLQLEPQRSHSLRHDALLVLITLIWGGTFLIVKNTVRLSGPFTYLALSYSIGSLTLALIFHRRLRRISRTELLSGLVLGMIWFTGYALQTIGLQYITVSKAGFITGLYVPLVPVFSFLLLRQRPTQGAIVGIALSFTGLFLLSFNDKFNLAFGLGEMLILGAAIAFALHIVNVSKFAPHADATNLAIVQLTLASLLSFIAIPIARESFIMPPLVVWGSVLFMGVVDVAFTLSMMIWVQQIVSGTRAALIYALEPMWAALFGFMLAGDKLSLLAWIGCGFILSGMIFGRMGKIHLSLRKSSK